MRSQGIHGIVPFSLGPLRNLTHARILENWRASVLTFDLGVQLESKLTERKRKEELAEYAVCSSCELPTRIRVQGDGETDELALRRRCCTYCTASQRSTCEEWINTSCNQKLRNATSLTLLWMIFYEHFGQCIGKLYPILSTSLSQQCLWHIRLPRTLPISFSSNRSRS